MTAAGMAANIMRGAPVLESLVIFCSPGILTARHMSPCALRGRFGASILRIPRYHGLAVRAISSPCFAGLVIRRVGEASRPTSVASANAVATRWRLAGYYLQSGVVGR